MSEIKTQEQLEIEAAEQVREMAQLTMISGRINPIQERNLKLYPYIFFNDVENVTINYDFTSKRVIDTKEDPKKVEIAYNIKDIEKHSLIVCYKIDLKEPNNNLLEKRFNAIEKAVHELFWKEVRVEIYFNDKIVYSGKK